MKHDSNSPDTRKTAKIPSTNRFWHSHDNVSLILDNSPDSTFISRIDNFQFVEVNARACENYGYSRVEFLQMQIFDIEEVAPLKEEIRALYQQMPVGEPIEVDGVNKRKDGSTFAVHVRFCKLDDDYAIANVRNVTLKRQHEKQLEQRFQERSHQLQESEEKLLLLLNSTGEGIYGLDLKGNCTFCNSSCLKLLGYEEEGMLLGKNMHHLIHHTNLDGSPLPAEQCRIYKAFKQGQGTFGDDEVFWRADGSSLPVEYRSFPTEKNGEITGSVVTFLDISERKLVEETLKVERNKLLQMQKLESVGKLTGGLAHDFNNLLTTIIGNLDLLKLSVNSEQQLACIESAHRASLRGSELTQRLLAFSKKQSVTPQIISINDSVNTAAEMFKVSLGIGIEFVKSLSDSVYTTFADKAELENAILNLCINARDAMPEGGRLSLSTEAKIVDVELARKYQIKEGSYFSILVEDTGAGMPPDIQRQVFEPFFTTKAFGKGSGLGLSMVYGTMKQFGGSVFLESEEGVGTCFELLLPQVSGELPALPKEKPVSLNTIKDAGSILVIDDDPDVLCMIAALIESLGYHVYSASNRGEALALIRSESKLGFVLCDVVLGNGEHGVDVVDEIRKIRNDISFLFMSGYTDSPLQEHSEIASVGLLSKPFTLSELQESLIEMGST